MAHLGEALIHQHLKKLEPFEKLESSTFSFDKRLKLQSWTEAEIEAESATNDKCQKIYVYGE